MSEENKEKHVFKHLLFPFELSPQNLGCNHPLNPMNTEYALMYTYVYFVSGLGTVNVTIRFGGRKMQQMMMKCVMCAVEKRRYRVGHKLVVGMVVLWWMAVGVSTYIYVWV